VDVLFLELDGFLDMLYEARLFFVGKPLWDERAPASQRFLLAHTHTTVHTDVHQFIDWSKTRFSSTFDFPSHHQTVEREREGKERGTLAE
jgi:hypothetical protein